MKRVYTTCQVAKMFQVAARTVCKWCDAGRLPCYRIPGCQDRRVTREAVEAFAGANGLDLGMISGIDPAVLLIGLPPPLAELAASGLLAANLHPVTCATAWDAGIEYGRLGRVAAVAIDAGIPAWRELARRLAPTAGVVAVLPDDEAGADLPSGVNCVRHGEGPGALVNALTSAASPFRWAGTHKRRGKTVA